MQTGLLENQLANTNPIQFQVVEKDARIYQIVPEAPYNITGAVTTQLGQPQLTPTGLVATFSENLTHIVGQVSTEIRTLASDLPDEVSTESGHQVYAFLTRVEYQVPAKVTVYLKDYSVPVIFSATYHSIDLLDIKSTAVQSDPFNWVGLQHIDNQPCLDECLKVVGDFAA